jgi:hypothetical protein
MKLRFSKFGTHPTTGIYYCVPSPDKNTWLVLAETAFDVDTGDFKNADHQLSHGLQYIQVVDYFKENFNVDISDIGKNCIPRGRVDFLAVAGKSKYIVLHGNDTPYIVIHQIISEFGLSGISDVTWEYTPFEAMDLDSKVALLKRCPFMEELFDKLVRI